ncbi:MAG TPA: hypothetical protein VMW95_07340 [Desulfobacterales bacterium]|nr:hypothetical protein [Desulfobacterales bacterium]
MKKNESEIAFEEYLRKKSASHPKCDICGENAYWLNVKITFFELSLDKHGNKIPKEKTVMNDFCHECAKKIHKEYSPGVCYNYDSIQRQAGN